MKRREERRVGSGVFGGGFPLPTQGGGLPTDTSSIGWEVSDGQKRESFSAFLVQGVPIQGRRVFSSARVPTSKKNFFGASK